MVPKPPSSSQDDGWASSSFCLQQARTRRSLSHASRASEAGPSNHARRQYYESTVDNPERDHIPTHSRHMERNSRSTAKKDKSANTMSDPSTSSTTPSQPVLVRSYSGDAEDSASKRPTISARRLLSFSSSRNSTPSRSNPTLPTDKDFSMENILQAIEPDVCATLDSIAEICGRSKLSLANEYESHIAPLGEIRAPPGGLVPVEEASSSDERQADEGIVVFDDEAGLVGAGGDLQPFSFYRYLEVIQQTASARERTAGGGSGRSRSRNSTHASLVRAIVHHATQTNLADLPATREGASQSRSAGRGLLATSAVPGQGSPYSRKTATPAVVSEIHLDAQAGGSHADSGRNALLSFHGGTSGEATSNTWHALEVLSSLLRRIGKTTQDARPETCSSPLSAEGRLRSMLQHSAEEDFSFRAV